MHPSVKLLISIASDNRWQNPTRKMRRELICRQTDWTVPRVYCCVVGGCVRTARLFASTWLSGNAQASAAQALPLSRVPAGSEMRGLAHNVAHQLCFARALSSHARMHSLALRFT
jgi:hypothetical protein